VQWAREHLHQRPTPADLAAQLDLTPDYFSRVFRHTFGCAPRDWLVRERIAAAGRVLRDTNVPVSHVARNYGYADAAQFSRQFKQETGLSPRRYRQER
jgi:AraC-like DNA-binding protein